MADLRVYIDFKSPYAYLAIAPTRRLASELGIAVDWRPFVLDIPSYLGSARLGEGGQVAEQNRSESQWEGVKYAYYDCRRYANLRGMVIRGTRKIWDTELAAIGMLWAREQGEQVMHAYLDGVYVPFWKRELDLEDVAEVERVLAGAGVAVQGFRGYAGGEGLARNRELQAAAFDDGIFGVPTYELAGQRFFGREHLPRIRWMLQGERGPAPDIANELLPGDDVSPAPGLELDVAIAPGAIESYFALERIFALADALDVRLNWYRLSDSEAARPPPPSDQSRGARHLRYRADNRALDQRRYLPDGRSVDEIRARGEALLRERGVQLIAAEGFRDLGARGYVGTPQFRLGDEIFVGRQHLPLIRARLERFADK